MFQFEMYVNVREHAGERFMKAATLRWQIDTMQRKLQNSRKKI